MVNYQLGKIYKLVVKDTHEILYVGSTCEKYLSNRMGKHRTDYNRPEDKRRYIPVYNYIKETCGIDNIIIVLICNFPCDTREELLSEERRQTELIGFDKLKNVRRQLLTDDEKKQYKKNKEHTEKRINYKKKYEKTEKRVEYKKQYNKQYIQIKEFCECGSQVIKCKMNRHKQSIKHLKYIESKMN